jgi:hypothetical protein
MSTGDDQAAAGPSITPSVVRKNVVKESTQRLQAELIRSQTVLTEKQVLNFDRSDLVTHVTDLRCQGKSMSALPVVLTTFVPQLAVADVVAPSVADDVSSVGLVLPSSGDVSSAGLSSHPSVATSVDQVGQSHL